MANIKYEIIKNIKTLSETDKGYTKELNLVSWNDGNPKLDIRTWYSEHEKCGKGITLNEDEGKELMNALIEYYAE